MDCTEGRCETLHQMQIVVEWLHDFAMLCCHLRREMRVGDVRVPNALLGLYGCCIGFVLGESRGTKPCVFSGKVVSAGDEPESGCWSRCNSLKNNTQKHCG